MLSTNTTRGVSFDPSVARRMRETKRQIRALSSPDKPVARIDGTPREYGMYLDQTNSAWKQRARDRRHS